MPERGGFPALGVARGYIVASYERVDDPYL
jgi:hypothetical protein